MGFFEDDYWVDTETQKEIKPMMQKPTTKHCRKCGCTDLVELSSLDRKRCSNCRRLIYWPLTEGQKPLL